MDPSRVPRRADVRRDPRQHLALHQPELGRPGGGLRDAGQHAGLEPLRAAVRGDVCTDDLLPARQQTGRVQGPGPLPGVSTRSSSASPSGVGSRPSGAAPLQDCSTGAGRRVRRATPAPACGAPGQQRGPRRRRRPGAGLASWRQRTRRTSPAATSHRAPLSCSGTSPATAAVTSTCSAGATSSASALASVVVELGEDVVEDQHRLTAVSCAAGRTPPAAAPARTTRTRRGWRSPLAGQLAEGEDQVVAVRADQGDAPVELARPGLPRAPQPARPPSRSRSVVSATSSGNDDRYSNSAGPPPRLTAP